MLRAPDPTPLIRFYRDVVGLGVLRGRETPPEQASAMMWAGGTTVFEPNRLTGETLPVADTLDTSAYVPVFRSRDIAKTRTRLTNVPVESEREGIIYFRDPLGFFFGLTPAVSDASVRTDPINGEPLSVPDVEAPLADDILDLGILEVRSDDPAGLATFYADALNLKRCNDTALDMGDGAIMAFTEGSAVRGPNADDREAVPMVPVFRLYAYEDFVDRVPQLGISKLQEVELTGGSIWYGWDAVDRLFGFQERRPPDPAPDKWTTRLPEDLLARRLWETA